MTRIQVVQFKQHGFTLYASGVMSVEQLSEARVYEPNGTQDWAGS